MKISITYFPGKVKKKYIWKSDMLIGTSRRESVICPLLLVVVLCGYQIYEFEIGKMIMAMMAPTKKESDLPEIVKIEGC
jgi:hypothetical protein